MANAGEVPVAAPAAGVLRQTVLLLGVFGLALLLRASIADMPLERDEGEYAYIAQRWLQGEVPYLHSFDQKPPGAFALYALVLACLGPSPAAIHWAAQLYLLATAGVLFLLGRKLFSAEAGLVAAGLLLFSCGDLCVLGNAFNTETVMLLPLVGGLLAALLAVERSSVAWALLAGALSAAAMLGKQVALSNVVFYLLLLVVLGRPRMRLALGMVLGGAVVFGSVTAYFAAAGALEEFWDCVVGHNLSYATAMPWWYYPGGFLALLHHLLPHLGPIFLLAAAGLCGWRLPGVERRPLRLAAWWLLFSVAGVWVGGYFREHYFIQALPAVALLAAQGAVTLARLPVLERVPAAAWLLAGLCLAWGVWQGDWYYLPGSAAAKAYRLYGYNPFPESLEVGRFLAEQSAPDDALYVFGSEPQIYFYAGRRSSSRYIFAYPLMMVPAADTRARQQSVLAELRRRPPTFLLTINVDVSFLEDPAAPRDLREGIEALQRQSYDLAGVTLYDAAEKVLHLVTPASGTEVWARACWSVANPNNSKEFHTIAIYRRQL